MPKEPHPLQALLEIEKLRHQRVASTGLSAGEALLRRWQAQRLAATYADLLAHDRYAPAGRFFLDDLYGPRDFSQRDYDLTRLYDFAQRIIPGGLLQPLARIVELHFLTHALDARLLDALVNRLGVTDQLTAAQYAEGYRLCDNYADRRRQIDMLLDVGAQLDRLARVPLIAAALKVGRGPARRAGWMEITDFLERGYHAFRHMRGATFFLSAIRQRETRLLDRIFARDPDPFGPAAV